MAVELIGFSFSMIAGAMAVLLFYLTLTQKQKRDYYIFSLLFLTASWAGLEYGMWLTGNDMFDMILYPAVPLDFFFAAWIAFSIWTGERVGQRKVWITWVIVLAIIFAIARACMNCVHF